MTGRQNVQVQGVEQEQERTGEEAQIQITESDKALTIVIPNHLKVSGLETAKGNITIATTHGNVLLPSNMNLSVNLWQRGATGKPRRNVTVR